MDVSWWFAANDNIRIRTAVDQVDYAAAVGASKAIALPLIGLVITVGVRHFLHA